MNGHDPELERESALLAERLMDEAPVRARAGLLDQVLAQTRITPQLGPRPWWQGPPLERPAFPRPLKFALVGVLVVVLGSGLALVGGRLADRGSLSGADGTDGPPATPASPAASAPDPSPRPAWITDQWNSTLDPGVPYYFDLPARVTFEVPSGWSHLYSRDYGSVIANDLQTAAVGWFVADNLFRDPCNWQDGTLDPPVGPTVDDMVNALSAMPGFVVVGPTREMIGGLPAQSLALVLTVDESACDGSQVKVFSSTPTGGKFDPKPGTTTVRLLVVGGTRLAVTSWTPLLDPAGATLDIEAIVRSMHFE